MRDLTIRNVDVGCDVCAVRATSITSPDTMLFVGLAMGLVRDEVRFCDRHLAVFKHTIKMFEKGSTSA